MLMVGNVGVNRVLGNCLDFNNIRSIRDMVFQSPGGFESTQKGTSIKELETPTSGSQGGRLTVKEPGRHPMRCGSSVRRENARRPGSTSNKPDVLNPTASSAQPPRTAHESMDRPSSSTWDMVFQFAIYKGGCKTQ